MKRRSLEVGDRLREVVNRNRKSGRGGVYAVCSAHPWVLEAAAQQALEDESVLHVESTSSQVNQEGGYTGQTPAQFAQHLHALTKAAGLTPDRLLLGADHLGPFPWRHAASAVAMEKACRLVRACVQAGYRKLHLDASMACADDGDQVAEHEVADRAAILCEVAEKTSQQSGLLPPLYVVGTEVPAPGGQSSVEGAPAVTSIKQVERTLKVLQSAFQKRGVSKAWERVIGLVVQPGVEFGDHVVFNYDPGKTRRLSAGLPNQPHLVYEAHSTDYQSSLALAQMVHDHFAILKVGPWLTFAFREAVFALIAIEQEILGGTKAVALSQVRPALESAMLRDPSHWQTYYGGDEKQQRIARAYSFSDRSRYYWHVADVQEEIKRLLGNLSLSPLPLTLLSQFLPAEYEAIRAGCLPLQPGAVISHHIRQVLRAYAAACA
jgi:D-tagatose-1,6-bisphosphate aldolase subunit GatZ/KbaZ